MKRPDLLAHSAPRAGAAPQCYEEHLGNVRKDARMRADEMLHFAAPNLRGLVDCIEAAAIFHDLGKLDLDNQAKLAEGRKAKLCWDHIDAGVAHLSAVRNWMAAWLVRAHNPPGLPSYVAHFDNDGLGRKLRGRRNDEDEQERHNAQIARTNINLPGYLADHESATTSAPIKPMKAIHGLPLRLALSCLVDADHSDTAEFDTCRTKSVPPEPHWQARLEAEASHNYPEACKEMRVIDADTRFVVVDADLVLRLEQRLPVAFTALLRGSVQIWASRIELLGLKALPPRQEVYRWPYRYDSEFLGYMAGVLDHVDLAQSGFAII
jgi:hypothetical protein